MSKLIAYAGAGTTTGANFCLEIADKKILIDCGMLQGAHTDEYNRTPFSYPVSEIDYLFVTHAHVDHVGLIPKLVKEGFKGEIFSTAETKSIAELLMLDAAKISAYEDNALYTANDVSSALSLWQTLNYHEVKNFAGFTVETFDAGHVLGSSMYKFTTEKGSMLFTGDIGNSPSPILRDHEFVTGIDYLLMESVYGDRNHEPKSQRDEIFEKTIKESIERGGTVLIPAFSLERTQVLLYELNNLFETKKLSSVPVYLDSPLSIRITAIYEKVKDLYNSQAEGGIKGGDDIFKFKELIETVRVQDSREIAHMPGAKIIIAGSGMSTAGRILNHEEHFLPDPNTTLILAGFQALGTLGRELEEGAKKVLIDEREVEVRAKIVKIDGFSGHADSNALVEFVEKSGEKLKQVFVAMGEPKSAIFLTQRLRDELGVNAIVTERGKEYEIEL